jgi:hypothetical protein
MTTAVLVTYYPERLAKKMISKLRKHGVDVVRTLHEGQDPAKVNLSKVDVVLVMHEYTNHNDSRKVQSAAKRAGKPVRFLSRHTSTWSLQPHASVL